MRCVVGERGSRRFGAGFREHLGEGVRLHVNARNVRDRHDGDGFDGWLTFVVPRILTQRLRLQSFPDGGLSAEHRQRRHRVGVAGVHPVAVVRKNSIHIFAAINFRGMLRPNVRDDQTVARARVLRRVSPGCRTRFQPFIVLRGGRTGEAGFVQIPNRFFGRDRAVVRIDDLKFDHGFFRVRVVHHRRQQPTGNVGFKRVRFGCGFVVIIIPVVIVPIVVIPIVKCSGPALDVIFVAMFANDIRLVCRHFC